MPGLVVHLFGDASRLLSSFKESTVAAEKFATTVKVGSEQAARAQVAASVQTQRRLREQIAVYAQVGAAAEKGSAEAAAAARLQAQAQNRLQRELGQTATDERRVAASTAGLGREMSRFGRGALFGSGIMRGFGRSLALASGGFLAFEGVTHFLEESVSVAREAAVSQRSLAAQMKTSGEVFATNRDQIEKAGLSLSKFGFTSEEVDQALVVLDRGTGRIDQAMSLLGLSADLARAKQIDLSAAGNVVAKVFGGQETALRRAVPGLEKNAHGWDLIRQAQAKLAGQAAAGTTPSERFAATLHETQRIIGTALLPTLNKYLTSLSKWLDKSNQTGQTQKTVNKLVKDATPIFDDIGKAAGLAAKALGRYSDALDLLRQKSKRGGIGGDLSDALRFFVDPGFALGNTLDFANRLFGGKGPEAAGADAANAFSTAFLNKLKTRLRGTAAISDAFGGFVTNVRKAALAPLIPARVAGRGPTAEQRNAAFDATLSRQLGRVQDISTVSGQIGRLQQLAGLITRRIAVTKDITRRLKLEDEVLGIFREIKADRQQLAQDAIDALSLNVARAGLTASVSDDVSALEAVNAKLAEQQKQLGFTTDREQQIIANLGQIQADRQQAAQAAHDALVARQFAALGLDPTGGDLPPTIKALQRQAAAIQKALGGMGDSKTRDQLARIRRVLGGGLGAVTDEVKQKIKELLDALKPEGGLLPPEFKHLGTRGILQAAGIDLGPEATRRLRSVLAGLNPAGNVIAGRTRAFAADVSGGDIHIHGGVHLHGIQDLRAFEDQLTRREAARSHRRRGAH